jgi:hypothetical protein
MKPVGFGKVLRERTPTEGRWKVERLSGQRRIVEASSHANRFSLWESLKGRCGESHEWV